jgi:hypothetical protein
METHRHSATRVGRHPRWQTRRGAPAFVSGLLRLARTWTIRARAQGKLTKIVRDYLAPATLATCGVPGLRPTSTGMLVSAGMKHDLKRPYSLEFARNSEKEERTFESRPNSVLWKGHVNSELASTY